MSVGVGVGMGMREIECSCVYVCVHEVKSQAILIYFSVIYTLELKAGVFVTERHQRPYL